MRPGVLLPIVALVVLAFPLPAATATTVFDVGIPGFDGHTVPARVYLADEGPAPTLLWGHGWAGSKDDSGGYGNFFASNGYNVVAMDFRGHGAARSTSMARVHDVDAEIRDVSAVIDWIATQPWAQLDGAGDPRLGALGGSYGGGYQLLTAAFDDRLDAIAPEITWNDLPRSLAPNGGIKSAWVDLLYGGGVARASLHPIIHQAYAWAMSTNDFPDGSLPGEPDIVSMFVSSSPKSYPDAITIPTFVIQGVPDTLFNFNEALDNLRQIAAAQAAAGKPVDVQLMTHLGGHILSSGGTIPVPLPDTGLQPGAAGSPCGSVRDEILAFYDARLKRGDTDDGLPEAQLALDDGTCVDAELNDDGTLALLGTRTVAGDGILVPYGGPSNEARLFGQDVGLPAIAQLTVDFATEAIVAGAPTLTGTITSSATDATLYFSLVAVAQDGSQRIIDAQVTPLRFAGPLLNEPFELELGGIATRAEAGDLIVLQVTTVDAQFAQNFGREPAVVFLSDVALTLPIVG